MTTTHLPAAPAPVTRTRRRRLRMTAVLVIAAVVALALLAFLSGGADGAGKVAADPDSSAATRKGDRTKGCVASRLAPRPLARRNWPGAPRALPMRSGKASASRRAIGRVVGESIELSGKTAVILNIR